jgi:predicted nucleic acid-binding Zn ribbon protein
MHLASPKPETESPKEIRYCHDKGREKIEKERKKSFKHRLLTILRGYKRKTS